MNQTVVIPPALSSQTAGTLSAELVDALAESPCALRRISSMLQYKNWPVSQSEVLVEAKNDLPALPRKMINVDYHDHSSGDVPQYRLPPGTRSCHLPGGYYKYTFEPYDGPVEASCSALHLYLLADGRELFQFESRSANPATLHIGAHFDAIRQYLESRKEFLERVREIKSAEPLPVRGREYDSEE